MQCSPQRVSLSTASPQLKRGPTTCLHNAMRPHNSSTQCKVPPNQIHRQKCPTTFPQWEVSPQQFHSVKCPQNNSTMESVPTTIQQWEVSPKQFHNGKCPHNNYPVNFDIANCLQSNPTMLWFPTTTPHCFGSPQQLKNPKTTTQCYAKCPHNNPTCPPCYIYIIQQWKSFHQHFCTVQCRAPIIFTKTWSPQNRWDVTFTWTINYPQSPTP